MIGNQHAEDLRRCCDALDAENKRLRESLRKAEQLTHICTDWNLDEVEIDGEMVSTCSLGDEFRTALQEKSHG